MLSFHVKFTLVPSPVASRLNGAVGLAQVVVVVVVLLVLLVLVVEPVVGVLVVVVGTVVVLGELVLLVEVVVVVVVVVVVFSQTPSDTVAKFNGAHPVEMVLDFMLL